MTDPINALQKANQITSMADRSESIEDDNEDELI
jgi:hypothetical protein